MKPAALCLVRWIVERQLFGCVPGDLGVGNVQPAATDAEASPLIHGQARDVFAVDKDLTVIHANKPRHHIEAGGFSCSVGAQQTNHFAAAERETDPTHDLPATI